MPSILILGPGFQFEKMFRNRGWSISENMDTCDAIQFTGGADVDPTLYGELKHPRSFCTPERDEAEARVYQKAIALQKPCLGVCRGGQFLNVMNGGRLYQHVENHAIRGTHLCHSSVLDRKIEVTSTHHQMMVPSMVGFVEGWAWNMSPDKEHMNYDGSIRKVVDDKLEAETIWYEDTKSLCFQPHPEYEGASSTESYYFQLIHHFLGL